MKKTISGNRLIIGYIGIFLILVGLINLLPLVGLIFYPEDHVYVLNFLIPGGLSMLLGLGLSLDLKNKNLSKFKQHEDKVFVVLVWVVTILITSMPFYLEGYSATHAIFEATSGLTTTGTSIVTVVGLPKIYQIHQMILLFLGGIGLVLVMTSAVSDRHGLKIYHAEGHQDNLMSNLAKSAKLIMTMYLSFMVVGAVVFILFGMDVFDAFFYAVSAVSTGGFAPHLESIGYYNHFGIEVTAMILMILGATNFLTHLYLLSGQFKKVFHHGITYLFIGLIIVVTLLATFSLFSSHTVLNIHHEHNFLYYLRHSLFTVVSTVTTTGMTTISTIQILPSFTILLICGLMLIGGQAGSTSGAIKQDRILIALQSSYWYIRDKMSLKSTIRTNFVLKYNHYEVIEEKEIRHNYAFIMIYLAILAFGSLLIMSQGFGFEQSLFDMASAMSNTGFSQGVMQSSSHNFVLWILTFAMFIGRLEFTILFIVIIKVVKDMTKREKHR